MTPTVILASASPRRLKIFKRFNVPFKVRIPAIEEVHWSHRPVDSVMENARRKHAWCSSAEPDAAILAADTLVTQADRLIGKPATRRQAREWLILFSGCQQTVLTACAVSMPDQTVKVSLDRAAVVFKTITSDVAEAYLRRVNPLDKAGGYDIDQCGEMIIESYTGDLTTIMGLPEERVAAWLRAWNLIPPET